MPEFVANSHGEGYVVGEQVIHWSFGSGVIVELDEKMLSGRTRQYYVVQTRDLMLWVPITESGESSLRKLTPAKDFPKLLRILAGPGEPLPADRFVRRTQLSQMVKDGTLESICQVIRDLVNFRREKKMNDYDGAILERATNFLVDEWSTALNLPEDEVKQELSEILKDRQARGSSI